MAGTQAGSPTTTLAALERARENCGRLFLLVQEIQLNPSAANIDAIVAQAQDAQLTPKPTTSVDGESYDWAGYQAGLLEQMDRLTDLINRISGPWEIRTRART